MKTNGEPPSEFQKFDAVVGRLLAVPRKELQKRERQYQRKRARLKKKKTG